MKQHIFLSPHLDDVVLSCGGLLADLSQAKAPIQTITLFAGIPNPDRPISPFAAYQHQMWGTPDLAYDTRRAEDAAALACFGLESTWLDYFDCIYRGEADQALWYYNSDDDIFGPLHPAEIALVQPLVEAILAAIQIKPVSTQTIIYAPLTVGNHVDHQLAFLAALKFLRQGYRVRFYEEYPYADRDPANLAKALTETTPTLLKQGPWSASLLKSKAHPALWHSTTVSFSEHALALKIRAIAAYQTQLEVLFGGAEEMAQRVQAYAAQVGQGSLAERYWQLNL